MSNTANATLSDPATPSIVSATATNPTSCGGNGTLALTFTDVPDGTYTISYDGGSWSNVSVTNNTANFSVPA